MTNLVKSCTMGYTQDDIARNLDNDPEQIALFRRWMSGQTGAICDGRRWDAHSGRYLPTECASNPHGPVVYSSDFYRFINRLPVLD